MVCSSRINSYDWCWAIHQTSEPSLVSESSFTRQVAPLSARARYVILISHVTDRPRPAFWWRHHSFRWRHASTRQR